MSCRVVSCRLVLSGIGSTPLCLSLLCQELQKHYDTYMEKYRNLDFLEHESEKYQRNDDERREEQERRLKKMRERLLKVGRGVCALRTALHHSLTPSGLPMV